MGKKTKKRPRWRKLSLDDGEERRSPSPGHSEGGGGVASQRDKYRPRSRNSFSRSHSVTTYVFDEDEYTKIQTPRQDMIFKKSAFTRRRAPADGSLSEEAETLSVGAGSGSEPTAPSCPPTEQPSSTTPELSEVSSEGKPASECGEGSEPRDPLAALASQIQYAFIDPQGNVYFNVMDESGVIHLPPVAGYYMAPSYPGGPLVATPVPWQAVPIAPLDSPEYQALMRQQQQQQQAQQTQQQEQQPADGEQEQQPADGQQEQSPGQQQQTQELANGETSSRSEISDDAAGSRPTSPALPERHNSSGPEHDYPEPEQQVSPGDEGKTRRLKKKKKKQKKKTNSVDSGVTDDGSDGCREPPPTPDIAAISSDSSASGVRVRAELKASELPASDQTSSGVQSDVSLPDSPQRRPSGDRGHVTGTVLADTGSRDGQLLHSAVTTVLSRQLDSQHKMQPAAAPQLSAQQAPAQLAAQPQPQPLPQQPESQPKNEAAAVSALEAAILSQVQLVADAGLRGDDQDAPDAPIAADEASEKSSSPDRELGDDDAESCDSFVYEDKSLGGEPAASPPPTADFLDEAAPPASEATGAATGKSVCVAQASEVVAEFEDEPVVARAFTDLSQPVDLRRTVILEETESERDRESSPGSVDSQESSRLSEKESSEERQVRSSEERLESSGKLQERCQEETAVKQPVVEEIVSATAAVEVCAAPDVNFPSKEESLIEGLVHPASTEAPASAPPVAPCMETRLSKDTSELSPVLPSDVAADLTKEAPKALTNEAPKALSSASTVASPVSGSTADPETCSVSNTVPEPAPLISLQPHLAAPPPAPDTSPPPDGAPPPSPPSSLSDRSISSAVRGWLKDQSPEAVFVVADDDDEDDSDLDGDDADWESDADADADAAPATTPAAPPKNARGNPSPVRRSSAGAGERVAIRSKAPAARLHPAAYYTLAVALDEPDSPPAVLRLVDLDERAVLTVPLDGAGPAGAAASAAAASASGDIGSEDGSEELDTGALGVPAPAAPPRASLAQELLQVGSLHRASDRQLIGDSALFSDATSASKSVASRAAVVGEAVETDEGYGGSPLASPEARPRPRGLPPHPLHHLGTEAPAPWGVCCSLQ